MEKRNITSKPFKELTPLELYEILQLRERVFAIEQKCLYTDMDNEDIAAWHTFAADNGHIVACARIFYKDKEKTTAKIGRVATAARQRHRGWASAVVAEAMRVAETIMKAKTIVLDAQTHVTGMYERLGFETVSDVFMEEGIPHVRMTCKTGCSNM